MLLWRDTLLCGAVALGNLRQALVVLVDDIVAAFLVDPEEAVEEHDLTVGAEPDLSVVAENFHRRPLQTRRLHLARQRPLPDEIVELRLIGIAQAQ